MTKIKKIDKSNVDKSNTILICCFWEFKFYNGIEKNLWLYLVKMNIYINR